MALKQARTNETTPVNHGFDPINVSTKYAEPRLSVVHWAMPLALAGSVMQAYANATVGAVLVAGFLLIMGMAIVALTFSARREEVQAFLLTYAVGVFVGGLAQIYSLLVFDNLQSTIDAFTFIRWIAAEPPFTTMDNMMPINAPLAILIWQQVYKVTWWVGLEFGPYTAVIFNAFVMGLTASLTVRIARHLFGDDGWRLQRVGWFFSFCGLFILFSAVLVRDGFTTFFSTLLLFAIVRWLTSPTLGGLFFSVILTGISGYAMLFLRDQVVLLFGIIWFVAFLIWIFVERLGTLRFSILFLSLALIFPAFAYISNYAQTIQATQTHGLESYAEHSVTSNDEESLGVRFVVNQPLPIRLVLGSGMLMINPIPLWNNFRVGLLDQHWIKGYNGFFQIIILPFVFVGLIQVIELFRQNKREAAPWLFLSFYLLFGLVAVVSTSLEQRHLGQFLPALIILAVLPDMRDKQAKAKVYRIAKQWFVVVILIHLVWLILRTII